MADLSPGPDLRLEMLSQPRLLAAARALVGNLAQRLGFSEIQSGQISLAVDEALCNIINHGYDRQPDGHIWLSLWDVTTDRPGVKVVIEDRARQVDPSVIRSRDLDDIRPGGLGVYIIREIMDEVIYEHRQNGGMRLTLVKHATDARPDDETAAVTSSGDEDEGTT
jgi:anti-sigma regulatory factor (Ser/Thr protein kinase)